MILLDTHAWVWWLSAPSALSRPAARAIEEASSEGTVAVSAISTWELAQLVARGRVALRLPVEAWVSACEALPELSFLPPSNRVMRVRHPLQRFRLRSRTQLPTKNDPPARS